jgi:hypothetical protein
MKFDVWEGGYNKYRFGILTVAMNGMACGAV